MRQVDWAAAQHLLSPFSSPFFALQRTNTKNWKEIFPEKELRGHSPNFHIHISLSDLFISMIDLPYLLQEICGPILGIYKSLTGTWMWKLGLRPRNSQKRNTQMGFSLQCGVKLLYDYGLWSDLCTLAGCPCRGARRWWWGSASAGPWYSSWTRTIEKRDKNPYSAHFWNVLQMTQQELRD